MGTVIESSWENERLAEENKRLREENAALRKWIRCADKMPAEKTRVICATRDGIVRIMNLRPAWQMTYNHPRCFASDQVDSIVKTVDVENVVAWMPLPFPPNASCTPNGA